MIAPIKNVFFNINNYCQFHCKYCWYRKTRDNDKDTKDQTMSLDTLRQAYQIFKEHQIKVVQNDRHNELNLIFATKEPLFEFHNLIKPFIEELNKDNLSFNIKFNILTNGGLLTDEIGKFCYDFDVKILISLDGNIESNNTNRIYYKEGDKENKAFTTTMNGASLLLPSQRHFTYTLNKNTIPYLYESLKFLSEYPHAWTRFNYNLFNPFSDNDWKIIQNTFKLFIDETPIENLQFLYIYKYFSSLIDENRSIIMGVNWDGLISIKKAFHSSIPKLSINSNFYNINGFNTECGTTANPDMQNLENYVYLHGVNYVDTHFENIEYDCKICQYYKSCHPGNAYRRRPPHKYYLLDDECNIKRTNLYISTLIKEKFNNE